MTDTTSSTICIVSQYFYPSTQATAQLVADIAVQLNHKSNNITVITSTPGEGYLDHVPILRSPAYLESNNNILSKITSGFLFAIYTSVYVLFRHNPGTTYLLFSNPPFICSLFALLTLLKKVRYIFVYQDLFPQSAVISGILPAVGPLTLFWQTLMNFGCSRASNIIVLSNSMKRSLSKRMPRLLPKTVVIHNWSVSPTISKTTVKKDFRAEWNASSDLILLYSGNLGRLHDIITFLECARLLTNNPVKFVFCGHGPKLEQVKRYIQAYGLSNVIVQPPVALEQLNSLFLSADIALMSTIPGATSLIAPSKLYGILASGKPVFYVGDESSEIAQLINTSKSGKTFSNGDSLLLSKVILNLINNSQALDLYAKASSKAYSTYFGLNKSIPKYQALL